MKIIIGLIVIAAIYVLYYNLVIKYIDNKMNDFKKKKNEK